MHTGSDMGGPGFASRRPNASSLPSFDLPHPSLSGGQKYHYAGSQASQTSGNLTSVGNLLTPPSTIGGGDISPSSTGSHNTSSAPPSQYSYSTWSPNPSQQTPTTYYHQPATAAFHRPQVPFSPANTIIRGNPHSPQPNDGAPMQPSYEMSSYPASAPLTPATVPSMAPHSQQPSHHQMQSMMGSSTPVSSGAQPSPVHAQEAFRPPPTPTYYQHQASTPQQSPYPFSTGPSPSQMTLSSTGPMVSRPQMSPASSGPMPSLPAPAVQSPAPMQGRFSYAHGPVMSNLHNPSGQPMLVGGLPHGMVAGFNSGHAASMQAMYANSSPQSQPQNDRPFKCDQCPQSFNRNHDLKRHKRIHLAVKPFPCGHCEKSFSRKDALKRHILVKGCGKAAAEAAAAKQEDSTDPVSPNIKPSGSENGDVKPAQPTQ